MFELLIKIYLDIFLTFDTSVWYSFTNKINGSTSLGLKKPMNDLEDGNLGLACGLGLYFAINDTDIRSSNKAKKILNLKKIVLKRFLLKQQAKNLYKQYFYS